MKCDLCDGTGWRPGIITETRMPFIGMVYHGVVPCHCRAVSVPSEEMQQIPAQYRKSGPKQFRNFFEGREDE